MSSDPQRALLSSADPPPYRIERPEGRSPFLITCDHAGRVLPARLGTLGLSDEERASHIAWDLGAEQLARKLAALLDAFCILQTYSRLVIDVNRPLEAHDSIATHSERTRVPGNEGLSPGEVRARIDSVFTPYHERIRAELDARLAAGMPTALVSLHSFTPVFHGVPRAVQVGVLYGRDARFGQPLLALIRRDHPELVVGDNEPYALEDASDYTVITHGERRGLQHVELELRQDLLATEAGCDAFSARLATWFEALRPALFPT